MPRIEPSRRAVLSTAGAVGLTAVAGCLDPDNNDTTETIDAPEPDTLQGNPIIYHGETYQLNNTEYTVPSSLDRGPQTVEVGGEEIDIFVNDQDLYEESIKSQFTGDSGLPIQEDHHDYEEVNVEGDTIQLKTKTETPREDMGQEIGNLAAVYTSAIDEDEIPYNFELEITDGNDQTFKGEISSEKGESYLQEETRLGEMISNLQGQM